MFIHKQHFKKLYTTQSFCIKLIEKYRRITLFSHSCVSGTCYNEYTLTKIGPKKCIHFFSDLFNYTQKSDPNKKTVHSLYLQRPSCPRLAGTRACCWASVSSVVCWSCSQGEPYPPALVACVCGGSPGTRPVCAVCRGVCCLSSGSPATASFFWSTPTTVGQQHLIYFFFHR